MSTLKRLTRRQRAVLEDLFAGELDEQAVLDKHNLDRAKYNNWLADPCFIEKFNECVAAAYRQSELILARYAPLAAAKLVQLTESKNQETARKACLDIISMQPSVKSSPAAAPIDSADPDANPPDFAGPAPLSPETTSRLLSALAEDTHAHTV